MFEEVKMKAILVVAVFVLASNPCSSRAVEESVVSDYTPASSVANKSVYNQLASNLADKITEPFYRFFGINNTTTTTTTKRPFEHIELQETSTRSRDVEVLSLDAHKPSQKPEKISLYTSYLPAFALPNQIQSKGDLDSNADNEVAAQQEVNGKLDLPATTTKPNDSENEVDNDDFDDDFDIDDVAGSPTQRGPFVSFLELVGSIIQLLWGGFLAIFQPSKTSS